jgi:lipoprotein-anchoring transpeptidase ErfK/SrfK
MSTAIKRRMGTLEMSFCRFAAITAVLTGLASTWSLAQEFTKSMPAQFSDARMPGDQLHVLRPPLDVIDPGVTGTVDPKSRTALPPEVRPETGTTKEIAEKFRRTLVEYRTPEPVGTIIVDTANTYLYLVRENGKAMRYGIGVGREGFTWAGAERISKLAEWPDWHPPAEMIDREPYLPRFMAGGEGNPLGARALYLGKSVYRIHGTNQPSTIGTFVSSGCIRLTNADIVDLYTRIQVGTRVVVLPGGPPPTDARRG